MKFEILASRNKDDEKILYYDNQTNILSDDTGFIYEYPKAVANVGPVNANQKPYVSFDKDHPLKKSKQVRIVKIQMGLSCNYSCDYCSQKFVERPRETTPKDIENFMELFNNLEFDEQQGLRVEFWGGEPFVYWKTMKPLAEAIADRFESWTRKPNFSVITNGSLLTEEICAWLYSMGFNVSISHDGPGQHVRGPDPFEDPKKREIVLDLYQILRPLDRISFNSMLNNKNTSRKAIYDWFADFTNDPSVVLGEGAFVDAYDADGLENSMQTKADHFAFRQRAFGEIWGSNGDIGFTGILSKIDDFTDAVLTHKNADFLGQKCGMDDESVVAFDLKGNVITCQNVSALEIGKNGEPHLGGTIADIENVSIHTATHWSNRKECSGCPVLHICKGACMFLDGEYWTASCNNAYSDAVPLFALSIMKITNGYIPVTIKAEGLPTERQDIFGTVMKHEEWAKKKTIPIKVVSEKVAVIDNVEVYGQSTVINS
jgi:uncharacterized protein